jgi:iron(III) transport system substrate-binding protein
VFRPLRLKASAIGLALVLAAAGCSSSGNGSPDTPASFPDPGDIEALYQGALEEGGELVWYYGTAAEPMRALAAEFEKQFPGIRVTGTRLVGVEQYQRFVAETEANQHTADVILLNDYPSNEDLIARGYLADWKVPTHDRLPEDFRRGTVSYAPWVSDIAIVYNRDRVTPEEVEKLKSWTGILDPVFRGRFAVATQRGTTPYAGLQMFTDPAMEPVLGKDFLQRVAAQKPQVYGDVLIMLDRVLAGDQDVAFWLFEAIGVTKYLAGAPVGWVHPNPTPVWAGSWSAVSANAPHPYAARLWQTWITSDVGAEAMEKVYGGKSALTGRTDTRPVASEPWYHPIDETRPMDYERWAKDYEETFVLWENILKEAQ